MKTILILRFSEINKSEMLTNTNLMPEKGKKNFNRSLYRLADTDSHTCIYGNWGFP